MNASPSLSDILRARRLPALDGLRAVAVGAVIAYHAGAPVPGDLGVSAFFVLSGFLITWLLLREQDDTGTVDFSAFYLRRTLRIFPAYYTFLLFSFSLDWLRGSAWPPRLGTAALTYTVNYFNAFNGHPTTSIAHAWSLAVEEQFYLLWPLAFLFLARRGRRAVAIGLGVAIAFGPLWRAFAWLLLDAPPSYFYNAFEARLDGLAVGCLLAVIASGRSLDRVSRWLTVHPLAPLVSLALLLGSRVGGSAVYHYTAGFTIDSVLLAALIVQCLLLAGHPLWAWLDHAAVRYLGLLSYPLYLYHQWGLAIGDKFTLLAPPVRLGAGLCACLALAAGSYYAIERPFLALKRRFARAATGEAPAPERT